TKAERPSIRTQRLGNPGLQRGRIRILFCREAKRGNPAKAAAPQLLPHAKRNKSLRGSAVVVPVGFVLATDAAVVVGEWRIPVVDRILIGNPLDHWREVRVIGRGGGLVELSRATAAERGRWFRQRQ